MARNARRRSRARKAPAQSEDAGARSLSVDVSVFVVRPEDLCVLSLRFINLRSDDGVNLRKVREGEPSFVVIELPPQHIAERAIFKAQSVPPLPVPHVIAGPSQIVYEHRGGVLPYFLELLLRDLSHGTLSVPANARPPTLHAAPVFSEPPPFSEGFTTLLIRDSRARTERAVDAELGGGELRNVVDSRPTTPLAAPAPHETAIELPTRLILAPHVGSAFAHVRRPYRPEGARRVELWSTRLGTRVFDEAGWHVDERGGGGNRVRAVWTPDLTGAPPPPFEILPKAEHRKAIVEQTALFQNPARPGYEPVAIEVNRLALTALGASFDAHVRFPDIDPANPFPVEEWSHIATMGRDEYVRVVSRGFLSCGHQATIIEIAERRLSPAGAVDAPVAMLVQRRMLVVRQPYLDYTGEPGGGAGPFYKERFKRRFPFKSIRITTTTTPDLSNAPPEGRGFWPEVGGKPLLFTCVALDVEGNVLRFDAPFAYFPAGAENEHDVLDEEGAPRSTAALRSQRFAVAQAKRPGDTVVDTTAIRFGVLWDREHLSNGARFVPVVARVTASIPALRQCAGLNEAREFRFPDPYLWVGFDAATNPQELFLQLVDEPPLDLDFSRQSDRSGGFVTPNLQIRGVSRISGPYAGTVTSATGELPATADIDPKEYFAGVLGREAKLFGVINLADLIVKGPLYEAAPSFAADAFDELQSFLMALARLEVAFVALQTALQAASGGTDVGRVADAMNQLSASAERVYADLEQGAAGLQQLAQGDLDMFVTASGALARALELDRATPGSLGLSRQAAEDMNASLRDVARFAGDTRAFIGRLQGATQAVENAKGLTTRIDWRPKIQKVAIFDPKRADGLLLRAEIRAKQVGDKRAGVDLLACLEDFTLDLFGSPSIIRIPFKRLQFSMEAGKKPDVDCVLGDMEFLGALAFLQALQKLIPSGGFSDPPFIEVDTSSIRAGFTLAFPNIGLGIFSLENIALSAELQIPFLGRSPSFAFAFCSRDNPFRLTVSLLGGGGFFGLTVGMGGLEMLECALEFGACVAINLGVASGSVSLVAGIYLRMIGDGTNLSGYVRIRGQVEVLGIVSISIEVRLELGYETWPKKRAYGRAEIILEVSIAFFSISVSASCEKSFYPDNSDPTFAELMAPEGDYVPWRTYCLAFA
ncbi:methyl-accepting chemotaxis protein [Sorangium sp. So ce327]|uniref:hypothetical protein n=1 Tax=Sorangium sp. So ce327 TaxID=3133301 RepID=UPI003F5FF8A5